MQNLLNRDIKNLLIRFYKNCKDSKISDFKREKRLKKIRLEISIFPKGDISNTAKILSKSRKRTFLFKIWCDIVVLTGEV